MAVSLARAAAVKPQLRARTGRRILMLTISDIEHDPRINKVARSLADEGYEVEIMAPSTERNQTVREVVPGVRYVKVPMRSPMQLFVFYQDEYLKAGRTREFDYVHANDLTTLTVAWALARARGVPLVYDAHELWTENVEFKRGEWVPMSRPTRVLAGAWERLLLGSVDLLVTVGPSIVAEYKRRDGLRRPPLLLANYPSLALLDSASPPKSIRERCGLSSSHFVTLYMGGVNPLRNIETVIEAHRHLPERHVFVVMGPGVELFSDEYRALAQTVGVDGRVFFLSPVGMDEVVTAARDANCGIVMLKNLCKNFYYFYPNKLFEYAAAGVPIATSEFPDAAGFVQSERCGVTFDPESPTSIAEALASLSANPEEARAMGARGRATILAHRNWESVVERLVAEYDHLT
jgi:glycosyltransferase involved in cell wall biosynthesis